MHLDTYLGENLKTPDPCMYPPLPSRALVAEKLRKLRRYFQWPRYSHEWAVEAVQLSEAVDKVVQDLICDSETTLPAYLETVFEKSRSLLYGAGYKEGSVSEHEIHNRLQCPRVRTDPRVRTELFENISSTEELKCLMLKFKQVLDYIVTPKTKPPNFSVSDTFRLSVQNALNSQDWEEVESLIIPIALGFLGRAAVYYAALVIAALLFLSRLYQYSIRLLDRGGGRIYSSGSLEFRSIYISIVLFQGSYIWIKFRDVAPESDQRPPKGLRRKFRTELGKRVYYGNFEPLFKPPGSKNYIYFGCYEKEEDAKACRQILAFWYDKKGARCELPLQDGTTYAIEPVPEEAKCLGPEEKKEWAQKEVKKVLECYQMWQFYSNLEGYPNGLMFSSVLPEHPDAGAGVIVPGGSIGVQADDPHPFQLGNQGGELVPSASPSNILNEVPGTDGMQHHTPNDTPSSGVGGDALNFPSPESIARSHREAATNIATSGTGGSNEQPLQPQRPETRLQGNQANDSTVHMIVDDFSVQRQVKELQRKRKESQVQAECKELQIKQLETLRSSLESQKVQWQSQKQQMENQVSELQRDQELLLLQNQQKETRIQEQDSRILELESANDVLESTHITRKRRCTGVTPTHDSQN
jgi:hypothetical protein